MGIDNHRVLYSWGRNRCGQLGQGVTGDNHSEIDQTMPSPVGGVLNRVMISLVACGGQHSMATTISGFIYSWGLNCYGQLGHGDFIDRNEP